MFDTEHKTDVESDNLWIFLIGVTAPDGTEYTDFGTQVPLYIQKDPDWDGNDIRSVFISGASDEVLLSHFHGTMDYPESALYPAAEFYKIMLSHFSPYAIFNELTDEEKAALTPTPNDNNNQTTDKPNSSGTDLPGTGDISTELLISGLAIVLVSSLGVMLRLITSKKKFEE